MPGMVFLPLRARETLSSSHQPDVSHATNKPPETQDIPRCSRRVISQACAMSGRASPSTGQMVVFRPGSWNHSSGRVRFAGRHWGMRSMVLQLVCVSHVWERASFCPPYSRHLVAVVRLGTRSAPYGTATSAASMNRPSDLFRFGGTSSISKGSPPNPSRS